MGTFIDITGQRFGRLVVLAREGTVPGQTCAAWRCRCDCGDTTLVRSSYLKNGATRSCGCLRVEYWKGLGQRQQRTGTLANRPGEPNNLGRILSDRGITEGELSVAAGLSQSHVNRMKNRKHAPTVRGAWKIVLGLRALIGEDVSFEAVWPAPKERRAVVAGIGQRSRGTSADACGVGA